MTQRIPYEFEMTSSELVIPIKCGTVHIYRDQRDFDNVIEDMKFGERGAYGGLCEFDGMTGKSTIYLFNTGAILSILSHEIGHAYFHSCGLSHTARNMGFSNIDELFALGCENLPFMAEDYNTVLAVLEDIKNPKPKKKEGTKNVKTKKTTTKSKKLSK